MVLQVDKGIHSGVIKFSSLCNTLLKMLQEGKPDKGIIRDITR
jgi:hypothetical protein